MTARIVAEGHAMMLGSVLGNVLGQKFGDYAVQSAVTEAFQSAARIGRPT
jgi:hypothetical protein